MRNILINDLKSFSYKELYSFIMSCPEESFEVQIARNNVFVTGDDNQALSKDYAIAAWMGQKLYDQSDNFCYWVPCLFTTEPFSFELDVSNKESFVDTLFDIISNYINPSDEKKLHDFVLCGLVYFMKVVSQQLKSKCWGLIEVGHDLVETWKDTQKQKS